MNGNPPRLELPEPALAAMWGSLPTLAERTVAAVVAAVPSYADAFSGPMGRTIETAVEQALAGFLRLTAEGADPDSSPGIKPALDGAYVLGQGEARQGRSTDVLLAAYRVGARTAWRELSAVAVAHGVLAETLGVFAELVFAYIDRLSALSVAGHVDELAKTGLARQRQRERLVRQLLAGASLEELQMAAERAGWTPPLTLTAIAVNRGHEGSIAATLDPRTLEAPEDTVEPLRRPVTVLLVPDVGGGARSGFIDSIGTSGTVIGPARPWLNVEASVRRVLRALELSNQSDAPLDTDHRLADLVVRADREALADLQQRVLAPMQRLRPRTREKLIETLRTWLLHQGRRDMIADALFVHPQTVRYRLEQLHGLYGDKLRDPNTIMEMTIALATADPSDFG
jgi:PucR C-terminal helix-turn-helix domain